MPRRSAAALLLFSALPCLPAATGFGAFATDPSNPASPRQLQLRRIDGLSDASTEIVSGVVEGFLHHEHLQPGEVQCLVNGTGDLAGRVTSISAHTASLLDQVLGKHSSNPPPPMGSMGPSNHVADGAGGISAVVDQMAAHAAGGGIAGGVGKVVHIIVNKARGLRNADWSFGGHGNSDPYVTCEIPGKPDSRVKTGTVSDGGNTATWNAELKLEGYKDGDSLYFSVMDADALKSDDLLGRALLRSDQFLQNGFAGELPLSNTDNGGKEAALEVHVAPPQESSTTPTPEAFAPSSSQVSSVSEPALLPSPLATGTAAVEPAQAAPGTSLSPAAKDSLAVFYGDRRLEGILGEGGESSANMKAMAAMAVLVLPQLGANLEELVLLSHDILKHCLHGDALQALRRAGARMHSLEQAGEHFLANGANIAGEMSDAVEKYERKDLHGFGRDLGVALRKVLLSNSTSSTLPEGLPKADVLANVSKGLMEGFFGEGVGMDLKLRGGSPALHVDLHECMAKNVQFFQSVWASAMYLFAKQEAQVNESNPAKQNNLGAALAVTMMQVPQAMRRCNITEAQEAMLMDSVKALGQGGSPPSLRFENPFDVSQLDKDTVALGVAETVKSWSKMEWQDFGKDLGQLLRAMVAKVFPQKYSIDGAGRLQAQLYASAPTTATTQRAALFSGALAHGSLALVVLLGLLALLSIRGRRATAAFFRTTDDVGSDGAE